MSKDGRIILAYCPQIEDVEDSIVTIDEARNAFFQRERAEEFTFFCSDPNCRSRISAVNYNVTEFYKAPHYRRINAHPHVPECYWNTYEEDHELDEKEIKDGVLAWRPGMTNYLKKFKQIDHRDVIDRFVPPAHAVNADQRVRQLIPHRRRNVDRLETLRRYKQTTTAFYRLVYTFRNLTSEEKQTTSIELPNDAGGYRALSYWPAFVHVKYIRRGHNDHRIFYGSTKIYKTNSGDFMILFRNKSPNYEAGKPDMQAGVHIARDAIQTNHLRRTLLNNLEDFSSNGNFCCCYIYGTIAPEPLEFNTRFGIQNRIVINFGDARNITLIDAGTDPKESFDCDEERCN